jgi:putative effector of murein hydrolase
MFNIYGIAILTNFKAIKEYSKSFAFKSITSTIKLIISCFINGLVHEESDRIYAVLDRLNGENLDEKEYKEWIMFKNVSKETMFGFTIGGFAALKKTTLIPVKINSK